MGEVGEARISAAKDRGSRMMLRISGRWTARWIPRLVVRAWLGWIFGKICATARWRLLRVAWNRTRSPLGPGSVSGKIPP